VRKPGPTEIRAELERILASRCFQQAGRASHFLRFVVEETLAGGGQRLKGYTIGVEVFGRPADFDAQSDALVRVEAGRLRRRLVEYYAGEGAGNRVRIDLPRGSYAADCRFARVDDEPIGPASTAAATPPVSAALRPVAWQRTALVLAALLVVALGAIGWQQVRLWQAVHTHSALEEPQRSVWPRLVVVPFENWSDNASLDAPAAGLTEEIMLRLGAVDVFIIASRASWYGDRPSHERSLVEAAAGGYVLTGSVRGSGAKARIAVRLIEADTGAQLWTAAYDEPLSLEQLRTLEDRVAHDVAAVAAPYGPIFEAELARARLAADAPKLRDCYATYHEYRRRVAPDAYAAALECYQRLSERQPDAAQAWSGLAMVYIDEYASTFGRTGDEALQFAREATAKALALDRDDFLANLAVTRVQFYDGDPAFRQAIDRSLALRPDSAQALTQGGFLLSVSGDTARGLLLTQKSRALSKMPPPLHNLTYAVTYLRERRFAEARAAAQKINARNWVVAQAVLAAAAAHEGRDDVARAAATRVRELYPQFERRALGTLERWYLDPEFREVLVSGLSAAGLVLEEQADSAEPLVRDY
jgi:adenylate cyclase